MHSFILLAREKRRAAMGRGRRQVSDLSSCAGMTTAAVASPTSASARRAPMAVECPGKGSGAQMESQAVT